MVNQQITPGWATYLRVSDEDKQTPERSFAMQRQRIQEHLLTASKVPFAREYTDLLSGTNPNRKDYQQMLSDAEAGKFSHLGLYRSDRFGRNTVEGLQAATKLIGLGIKIRVASMPSLRPEEPDGFFMFLIQMGMAQREVDVMRQRTRDGTEAKLRAGGWPNQAPEGYCNMERQIKSGKYERWVEPDPKYHQAIREAWDMLLTDRYTLDQICEELASQGYTRSSGAPWAWNTPKTKQRKTAKSKLHFIFNNPFYAGWVVSEPFNIPFGEIRGRWEPLVTTEEFEKGVATLKKHGANKSRLKRHPYLLRNLLWVEIGKRQCKMFGSTPSGRSASYSYYITHAKIDGKKFRLNSQDVDQQIPDWLLGITIDFSLIPAIKERYQAEIKQCSVGEIESDIESLKSRLSQLQQEEARLGRMVISGQMSEETYTQLREEWKEKVRTTKSRINELRIDARRYLDDLEVALGLISSASALYSRLNKEQKNKLLQLIVKRIIINEQGKITHHELHSPFSYLVTLASEENPSGKDGSGSEQVQYRPQTEPLSVEGFFGLVRGKNSYYCQLHAQYKLNYNLL